MKDLLNHKWALAESYFTRHFDVYYNALRHGHDLGKKKTIEDYIPSLVALLSFDDPEFKSDVSITFGIDTPTGLPVAKSGGKNIALIPVIGPLTKYDGLCNLGMQSYQSLLNRANASSSIDGIVLIMDTPGGTVDGTPEFGLAIKTSAKPVGVFGDGMVASAGMWLASQAGVVVGNKNNPTEFGSIGVLMALPNYQNMMEAGQMPKVEIFRASQSTEKAQVNSIEPITDAGRAQLQSELDDIANQFINTVKAGRGDALKADTEGIFAGRMYDVYKSKSAGLIDSVGTLQTAVNKVAELAKQKASGLSSGTGQGTNQNANKMKLTKLSALLGAAISLLTGGEKKEVSLTAEQSASLEASEKKLGEMETEAVQLRADNEAQKTKIAELEATVSGLKTQITTLEGEKSKLTEEKAELQKKVDAKPTGVATTAIPNEKKESEVNADAHEKGNAVPMSSATARGKEILDAKAKEKDLIV